MRGLLTNRFLSDVKARLIIFECKQHGILERDRQRRETRLSSLTEVRGVSRQQWRCDRGDSRVSGSKKEH